MTYGAYNVKVLKFRFYNMLYSGPINEVHAFFFSPALAVAFLFNKLSAPSTAVNRFSLNSI